MGTRMLAIFVVFVLTAVAWMVLGTSVLGRTYRADDRLGPEVAALWGDPQTQLSPELTLRREEVRSERETIQDPVSGALRVVTHEKTVEVEEPVLLDRSDVAVDLALEQRRKGLLWYSTYGVAFHGAYAYTHADERPATLVITFRFPAADASYDDFRFAVDGLDSGDAGPVAENGQKVVRREVEVAAGRTVRFDVAYRSRGRDAWRYAFGGDVNRVRDFNLVMTTDFAAIDFPRGTLSPTAKDPHAGGWTLTWSFKNLISGCRIGMDMPQRLNPGPLAARMSYFAPVCLGFFFVWMFVITLMRGIDLHPMNYLFLAAAFFAFHLLFAYTVDHVPVLPAFVLASAVSVFLVVSYLRLVVGLRFAALEAGGSQLVYLVLFSFAHFLEGLTGLFVTIGSILTLYALMQLTARVDWAERFRKAPRGATAANA